MHICAADDRTTDPPAWCPTLGECWCGGLLCAHGCQRNRAHQPRHAAPPLGSAAREATGSPWIGKHRG